MSVTLLETVVASCICPGAFLVPVAWKIFSRRIHRASVQVVRVCNACARHKRSYALNRTRITYKPIFLSIFRELRQTCTGKPWSSTHLQPTYNNHAHHQKLYRKKLGFHAFEHVLSQRRPLGKHFAAIFAGQVFRFSVLVVHVLSANVSVSSRVTTKLAGPNQGGTAALLVKVTSLHHEGQHTCKRHQKTITTSTCGRFDRFCIFSTCDLCSYLSFQFYCIRYYYSYWCMRGAWRGARGGGAKSCRLAHWLTCLFHAGLLANRTPQYWHGRSSLAQWR